MFHHFMSSVSRGYYVGKQVFGLPAKIVVAIFAGKFRSCIAGVTAALYSPAR